LPFGSKILGQIGANFLPALFAAKDVWQATLTARELFAATEMQHFNCSQKPFSKLLTQEFSSNPEDLIRQCELLAYTAPVLLADTDALSMHWSLETRVPFLNQSFVQSCFALPASDLITRRWQTKPALCAAVASLVPAAILQRPKAGFVLPMGHWLLTGLSQELAALCQSSLCEKSFVTSLIGQLKQEPWAWRKAWGLLVLERWLKSI
jgi:asparagine synthetase B (glutamine-hydrolysing)